MTKRYTSMSDNEKRNATITTILIVIFDAVVIAIALTIKFVKEVL